EAVHVRVRRTGNASAALGETRWTSASRLSGDFLSREKLCGRGDADDQRDGSESVGHPARSSVRARPKPSHDVAPVQAKYLSAHARTHESHPRAQRYG